MISSLPDHEREHQWGFHNVCSYRLGQEDIVQIFELITELLTAFIGRNRKHNRQTTDSINKKHFRPGRMANQSGRAPSEPSETPQWRITPRPGSIPGVTWPIALWLPFRHFFSLCGSPILNKHSGVVANCDHMSEWVHWVHACIGIAMQLVMLRKSLLTFLLH